MPCLGNRITDATYVGMSGLMLTRTGSSWQSDQRSAYGARCGNMVGSRTRRRRLALPLRGGAAVQRFTYGDRSFRRAVPVSLNSMDSVGATVLRISRKTRDVFHWH